MDLRVADGYKSPAQRARRLTEDWFGRNMYCPVCPSDRLGSTRSNTRVVDFQCQRCGAEFQVKARGGPFGARLRDAAYAPMMQRATSGTSPHFAFLQYRRDDWRVCALFLVPGHFITPDVIEKCTPLSPRARRAGWVGCNILASAIPTDGRVGVVERSRIVNPGEVRMAWSRFDWMAGRSADSRGWMMDVLRCVRSLGAKEFSLDAIYAFEGELAGQHPRNMNIRPKIRQQLQVLRDHGILRFLGRGRYAVI